jgi:hypothetical protein
MAESKKRKAKKRFIFVLRANFFLMFLLMFLMVASGGIFRAPLPF